MKKIFKYIIGALVVLAALFNTHRVKAAYAWESDNRYGFFYYYTQTDGSETTAVLSHYSGSASNVILPEKVDGYRVTTIDSLCFENNSSVTKITVPEGVTTINAKAFSNCSKLAKVILPSSLNKINDGNPISNCNSGQRIEVTLNNNRIFKMQADALIAANESVLYGYYGGGKVSYSIPSGVKKIFSEAFYGRQITEVTASEKVEEIGSYAFRNCVNLKKAVIGNDENYSILTGAFYNCTSLVDCKILSGISYIGANAFFNTELLKKAFDAATSYVRLGTYAIIDISKCKGTLDIPEGVRVLSSGMVAPYVDAVSVPSTLVSTGDLFSSNYRITKVKLKSGCKTIYDKMFYNASSLTSIEVPSSVTSIENNAFYGCAQLKKIQLPDNISSVGTNAFAGWSGAIALLSTSVTGKNKFPSSVKIEYLDKLDTPVLVSASSDDGAAKITWKAVSNALVYYVYRKTVGGTYQKIATVSKNQYYDKTAVSGKTYQYTVRAYGKYAVSKYNSTGLKLSYISAPKFTVANVSDGIRINVSKVAGAANYRIYRWNQSINDWKCIGTIKEGSFTDTVAGGTTNKYTVKATNGTINGGFIRAGKVITRLENPKITSIENTANGLKVSFTPVKGATKYRVYRKIGTNSYSLIKDIKTTVFYDNDLKSGNIYGYIIRAISTNSKSSYEKIKYSYHLGKPQVKVSNTASGITMKWDAIKGATRYIAYRKEVNGKYKRLAELSSRYTLYIDKNAQLGKTYQYTVVAVRDDLRSSYSPVTMVRLATPIMENFFSTSPTEIYCHWTTSGDIDGYVLVYYEGDKKNTVLLPKDTDVYRIKNTAANTLYRGYVCSYKKVGTKNYFSQWSPVRQRHT